MFVIFRESDKAVVGYSHDRRTQAQCEEALTVEIQNICQSELGGAPADYAWVEIDGKASGMVPVINDDSTVTWVTDPQVLKLEADRASAHRKLRALGLSDDEIQAFKS